MLIDLHVLARSPLLLITALIFSTALAMLLHELGHLTAARLCKVPASEIGLGLGPRLFAVRLRGFMLSLRALPVASFLRLDGAALAQRPLPQQLLVHLGGVTFNLLAALALHGTLFGWINLLLAAANLLPLYKHDGWKCGVVLMRAFLRKQSQPVEWVFTFSGGVASLIVGAWLIRM
jgi:membrane-associated protease RseP (regulator of RpoE activity)